MNDSFNKRKTRQDTRRELQEQSAQTPSSQSTAAGVPPVHGGSEGGVPGGFSQRPRGSVAITEDQRARWMAEAAGPESLHYLILGTTDPDFKRAIENDGQFLKDIFEIKYRKNPVGLVHDILTRDKSVFERLCPLLAEKRGKDPKFISNLQRIFSFLEGVRPAADGAGVTLGPVAWNVEVTAKLFAVFQECVKMEIGSLEKNLRVMDHLKIHRIAALCSVKEFHEHTKDAINYQARANVSFSLRGTFFLVGNPFLIAASHKNFEFISELAPLVMHGVDGNEPGKYKVPIGMAYRMLLRTLVTQADARSGFDCFQKELSFGSPNLFLMGCIMNGKEHIRCLPQLLELLVTEGLRLGVPKKEDDPITLDCEPPDFMPDCRSPDLNNARPVSAEDIRLFDSFWDAIIKWVYEKESSSPDGPMPMFDALRDMGFVTRVDGVPHYIINPLVRLPDTTFSTDFL